MTIWPEKSGKHQFLLSVTVRTSAIVVIRLAVQSVVMVVSVRLLGAAGFGLVSAAIAVSLVVGPFAGVGCDFVALRRVACGRATAGAALRMGVQSLALTAVPLLAAAMCAGYFWFGDDFDPELLFSVLLAEFVFLRGAEHIAKIIQGFGDYTSMATVRLASAVSRMLVLVPVFMVTDDLQPRQWGLLYLLSSVLALAYAVLQLLRRGEFAEGEVCPMEWADGAHFAGGVVSARLSSELDKALVLGLSSAANAGLYAAAYRFVALAATPVVSLVNVVTGPLYRLAHQDKLLESARVTFLVSTIAASYGALIGLLIWVGLPRALPIVLGGEFVDVSIGLVPLAIVPAAMSSRLVMEQALAAMNQLGERSRLQWTIALISVLLNLYFIPMHGWVAAAWVCAACECLLSALYTMRIGFGYMRLRDITHRNR